MKVKFEVEFTLPDGATTVDAKNYIPAAVRVHCGGMDPEMPMFHLDRRPVKVRKIKADVKEANRAD